MNGCIARLTRVITFKLIQTFDMPTTDILFYLNFD